MTSGNVGAYSVGKLPWWEPLKVPTPSDEDAEKIVARAFALDAAKKAFTVDHLAEVLLRHEDYCAGRISNENISPGIRWGLSWVAHKANRRFSTVKLERTNLMSTDEFGPQGWGARCGQPRS